MGYCNLSKYLNDVYENKTTFVFACIKQHWQSFNQDVLMDRNNKEYHISSSVQGVFDSVVYAMQNYENTKIIHFNIH